jgi:hypothetical protein
LETEERRVLGIESVADGGRFWVYLSLDGGVCSLNPDGIDGGKYNWGTVRSIEYYYPKNTHDLRFNWYEDILVQQDKALPRDPTGSNGGCDESEHHIASNTSSYRQLRLQAKANHIENK